MKEEEVRKYEKFLSTGKYKELDQSRPRSRSTGTFYTGYTEHGQIVQVISYLITVLQIINITSHFYKKIT